MTGGLFLLCVFVAAVIDITESLNDSNPVGTSIWRSPVTRATCNCIDDARDLMRALAAKAVE